MLAAQPRKFTAIHRRALLEQYPIHRLVFLKNFLMLNGLFKKFPIFRKDLFVRFLVLIGNPQKQIRRKNIHLLQDQIAGFQSIR